MRNKFTSYNQLYNLYFPIPRQKVYMYNVGTPRGPCIPLIMYGFLILTVETCTILHKFKGLNMFMHTLRNTTYSHIHISEYNLDGRHSTNRLTIPATRWGLGISFVYTSRHVNP